MKTRNLGGLVLTAIVLHGTSYACASLGQGSTKRIPLALAGSKSTRWESEGNLFLKLVDLKVTSADVERKLKTAWLRYSGQVPDDSRAYKTINLDAADPSLAYADVNVSHPDNTWDGGPRACTEGQGWAMMLAVQMNDQPMFDKLWRFTKKYMQLKSLDPVKNAKRGYYFAWQTLPQPGGGAKLKVDNDGPAPDGESWIAAALCCAAQRWGDGSPLKYQLEADRILSTMLHIDDWNGYKKDAKGNYIGQVDLVNTMQNYQVCYIPISWGLGPDKVSAHQVSDPSYCLPAFYDLFAIVGPKPDREYWRRSADHARLQYLPRALGQSSDSPNDNKITALSPYVTRIDGKQYDANGPESGFIQSGDGLRTISNLGVDYLWWSDGSRKFSFHTQASNKLLQFLSDPSVANPGLRISSFGNWGGYPYNYNRFWYGVYYTNGVDYVIKNSPSQGNNSSNHNEAQTGMNAVGAHAATLPVRLKFVEELWGANQPRVAKNGQPGTWGDPYWDGTLYMLGLLETAGRFRPWLRTRT